MLPGRLGVDLVAIRRWQPERITRASPVASGPIAGRPGAQAARGKGRSSDGGCAGFARTSRVARGRRDQSRAPGRGCVRGDMPCCRFRCGCTDGGHSTPRGPSRRPDPPRIPVDESCQESSTRIFAEGVRCGSGVGQGRDSGDRRPSAVLREFVCLYVERGTWAKDGLRTTLTLIKEHPPVQYACYS
jgi:hypothetical protein